MTMTKLQKFFALLVLASSVALAFGCGSNPAGSTPSPSPEPSVAPPPAPIQVIVKATAVQNGKSGITVVQPNEAFKINGTATQCFQAGVTVPCGAIPLWRHRQTGGGGNCSPSGDLNSNSVQYVCLEPATGVTFEVCALDFDSVELGCGSWSLSVQ